ncbi:tRNA synthetases class II-domain-containing protein [Xylariaceae sp. FL0662B]|nr:tRNA synthetases class II-domain-containing protein [Xylariaceae sp. FL0662B]
MTRFLSCSLPKSTARCIVGIQGRSLRSSLGRPLFQQLYRSIHDDASTDAKPPQDDDASTGAKPPQDKEKGPPKLDDPRWDAIKNTLFLPKRSSIASLRPGRDATIHGYLGKRRDKSSFLSFSDLYIDHDRIKIQIVSSWQTEGSMQHTAHQDFKKIPAYSPVAVTDTSATEAVTTDTSATDTPPADNSATDGLVADGQAADGPAAKADRLFDLKLRVINCLNQFPKDIIVSRDAVWPPKSRHLQLRFDPLLRDRIRLRHEIQNSFRRYLISAGFMEVETPILFKSTPEGAREFLVPTRREGYAYALPQSPQQYKQILMAGGFYRYFQFAKCFRDEDHRADRQPEFTQLDLEMAFARGGDVKAQVERVLIKLMQQFGDALQPQPRHGRRHPKLAALQIQKNQTNGNEEDPAVSDASRYSNAAAPFARMSYFDAMNAYGTDKPDLRIDSHASQINPIERWLPEDFIKTITSLENPIVEACKFRLGGRPGDAGQFIREFMDSLPSTPIKLSPESTPCVFVLDSSQPMQGLSALGQETVEWITGGKPRKWGLCEDGDIIIVQARKKGPTQGSSTDLGRLRTAIYESAVSKGLLPKDYSLKYVWIRDFPLFTQIEDDVGQGGTAGIRSNHHPFTAPLSYDDINFLKTDPLQAKADHYDLVLNGVEIGGGSRRIHNAELQEYIMRDVLKMTDEGVSQFSHLLEALRAGCPPHAGFALGFDRFLAVLCDVPSVKDVIAFPKSNKGEDLLVGSPSVTTPEQQETYHLERN